MIDFVIATGSSMLRTRHALSLLILSFVCGNSPTAFSAQRAEVRPTQVSAAHESSALSRVHPVAAELLQLDVQSIVLRKERNGASEMESIPVPGITELNFSVVSVAKRQDLGSCTIYLKANGEYNFVLNIAKSQFKKSAAEPDWKVIEKRTDAFMRKYWPKLRRSQDFASARKNYVPLEGVFHLSYSLHSQNIDFTTVTLDIRLADGRISALQLFDRSKTIEAALNGRAIPHEVDKLSLMSAIRKAVQADKSTVGNTLARHKVLDFTIESRTRQYGRLEYPAKEFGFFEDVILSGKSEDGMKLSFSVRYLEAGRKVILGTIMDHGHNDEPHLLEKSHTDNAHGKDDTSNTGRPFTQVVDLEPRWDADGKGLTFVTSRDVLKRPWWEREAVVLSIGRWRDGSMSLQRPIDWPEHDFASYTNGATSSSGRWQILSLADQNQLVILDLKEGRMYFPERRTLDEFGSGRLAPANGSSPSRWSNEGVEWLPTGDGVVIALEGDRDTNLYVVRWGVDEVPEFVDVVPLVVQRGADSLPCLNDDASTIAWAHSLSRQEDRKSDEPMKWVLYLADLNLRTLVDKPGPVEFGLQIDPKVEVSRLNTPNRRFISLPDKPCSISWDAKRRQ